MKTFSIYIADTPCTVVFDKDGHLDHIIANDETGPRPITRTPDLIKDITTLCNRLNTEN